MKVPYFNSDDHIVFIGGVMVPPNETRLVEESFIPFAGSTADSEPDNGNAGQQVGEPDGGTGEVDREKLAEMLKRKQEDVIAALVDLSLQEIEVLGELEQEGKGRQGILGAVAERLLESAAGGVEQ